MQIQKILLNSILSVIFVLHHHWFHLLGFYRKNYKSVLLFLVLESVKIHLSCCLFLENTVQINQTLRQYFYSNSSTYFLETSDRCEFTLRCHISSDHIYIFITLNSCKLSLKFPDRINTLSFIVVSHFFALICCRLSLSAKTKRVKTVSGGICCLHLQLGGGAFCSVTQTAGNQKSWMIFFCSTFFCFPCSPLSLSLMVHDQSAKIIRLSVDVFFHTPLNQ